jgi:hypothetical protein
MTRDLQLSIVTQVIKARLGLIGDDDTRKPSLVACSGIHAVAHELLWLAEFRS